MSRMKESLHPKILQILILTGELYRNCLEPRAGRTDFLDLTPGPFPTREGEQKWVSYSGFLE